MTTQVPILAKRTIKMFRYIQQSDGLQLFKTTFASFQSTRKFISCFRILVVFILSWCLQPTLQISHLWQFLAQIYRWIAAEYSMKCRKNVICRSQNWNSLCHSPLNDSVFEENPLVLLDSSKTGLRISYWISMFGIKGIIMREIFHHYDVEAKTLIDTNFRI